MQVIDKRETNPMYLSILSLSLFFPFLLLFPGCKRLETLRNKNIGQAMPSSVAAPQGGDNNEDEL